MAPHFLQSLLTAGLCLFSAVSALDVQLVGTWSTKSAKVLTGPGFYNPVNDSFIEPSLTGISYSFTSDGFYEEAYYRAVSNPTDPNCPQAIMQFQHGTIVENSDNSLTLTPIAVDGRQLQSNPCDYTYGIYTRYNQSETMAKWQVYTDPYHGILRLDLYEFDGTPMNPMYLAYTPPQMLPTTTMNPTATSASATATGNSKRSLLGFGDGSEQVIFPLNKDAKHIHGTKKGSSIDATLIWWAGVGMIIFGGAAYML